MDMINIVFEAFSWFDVKTSLLVKSYFSFLCLTFSTYLLVHPVNRLSG